MPKVGKKEIKVVLESHLANTTINYKLNYTVIVSEVVLGGAPSFHYDHFLPSDVIRLNGNHKLSELEHWLKMFKGSCYYRN